MAVSCSSGVVVIPDGPSNFILGKQEGHGPDCVFRSSASRHPANESAWETAHGFVVSMTRALMTRALVISALPDLIWDL